MKDFDLLAVAAAFAKRKGLALNDPAFIEAFLADAGPRLKDALGDSPLLYGQRTERLFEATVVSLGRYRLLKAEDNGRVHAAETLRAPDFRIVLDDGDQWLVEVKNVHGEDPMVQRTRLSAAYLASLRAYADAVDAPLRIAIYWSLWSLWTLVDPKRFIDPEGAANIDMMDAVKVNEFGRLGDVSILTMHPLRLVLETPLPTTTGDDDHSLVDLLFAGARVFSQDVELTDLKDRHMAILLMLYGEWTIDGRPPTRRADGSAFVELVAEPEEPSESGQDGIGWASRVFSRFFATRTVEEGEVVQLLGEAAPEWFAPLSKWEFERSHLPLVLLHQQPPDKEGASEGACHRDKT